MTANAFADDRAQCLQAGMNDFIAKPVDIEKLRHLVTHYLADRAFVRASDGNAPQPTARAATSSSLDTATGTHGDPILHDAVLTQLGADTAPELPRKLVEMFLAEIDQHLDELRRLQAAGDLVALGAAAHRQKGSAGTLGASRLHQAMLLLEKAGKGADATGAGQILSALEPIVTDTKQALRSWCAFDLD